MKGRGDRGSTGRRKYFGESKGKTALGSENETGSFDQRRRNIIILNRPSLPWWQGIALKIFRNAPPILFIRGFSCLNLSWQESLIHLIFTHPCTICSWREIQCYSRSIYFITRTPLLSRILESAFQLVIVSLNGSYACVMKNYIFGEKLIWVAKF